jgi:hypothetical protein
MKGRGGDRLTVERLKEVLRYDPIVGEFWWLKRTGPSTRFDRPAGCLDKNGYLKIKIDGEQHYGHRLAALYVLGYMPQEVDHRDLNRSNNRWKNLRPATPTEQMRNRRGPSSASGVKGVRQEGSGWRARIRVNGKKLHLGTFETVEEAEAAYARASAQYHGEFGRTD